jgi:peptidoglycan/xylan/chitin deacetylase (PgdA/CDA1 family)
MQGKRELIAGMSSRIGLTKLLEMLPQRCVLIVLNYHRIGDAAATAFDSAVFSATADEFDQQIRFLKRRFHIATLDEAIAGLKDRTRRGASVLITFDDGYIDNYALAFPILRSHGVTGVFFLPTAFVGTGRLPWWDTIAYIVKKSRRREIRLQYPEPAAFDLDAEGVGRATMRILRLFKRPEVQDTERFIGGLEAACDTARPAPDGERCFLNWDEARRMQAAGMAFGSHTHIHEILTKLPAGEQERELAESRRILEQQLGRPVDTLAYPVGALTAFSDDTKQAARTTGYRAAFSFYGGANTPGQTDPFDVRRFGVGDQSHPRLRLQTALAARTDSWWI